MNKNKNILKSLSKRKNIIWGEMEIIQLSESDDDEIKEIIIIDDKAIDINKNIKQEKEITLIDDDENNTKEEEEEEDDNNKKKKNNEFSENDNWLERSIKTSQKPISKDNIGYKLMVKMGYKDGEGLGKKNNGTISPINPFNMMKIRRVGIGMHPVKKYNLEEGKN